MTTRPLRLVTWNVNGLRAVLQRLGQSLAQFLDTLEADVICLQETKITRSELDEELSEELICVAHTGYDAFYSFCRLRGGYSGVVTFCRSELPTVSAEEGLTGCWRTEDSVGHVGDLHHELSSKLVSDLEAEGRCIITDHEAFVLLNTYCPALASADRLEYKLQFHALLQDRVKALRRANKHVIVVGDINISHRAIDHCEPEAFEGASFAEHPCRRWMDSFVCTLDEHTLAPAAAESGSTSTSPPPEPIAGQLVDVFRHFHPQETKAFTCWNTLTGARETNYGTRIDYILADPELLRQSVTSCSIEPERLGSDHCPVAASMAVRIEAPADATAAMCAKNFVEFSGTQQRIECFFSRGRAKSDESASPAATSRKRANNQRSITSFFAASAAKSAARARPSLPSAQAPTLGASRDVAVAVADVARKRKAAEEGRQQWQQVLSGRPPPTPPCHCGQPSVLRSVLKASDNWGRKFYVCTKPPGEKGDPAARCDFFQWADGKGARKKPKAL